MRPWLSAVLGALALSRQASCSAGDICYISGPRSMTAYSLEFGFGVVDAYSLQLASWTIDCILWAGITAQFPMMDK